MAGRSRNMSFSFSDAEMPVRFGRYMLLRRKSLETIGEHFLALWGVDEGIDQLRTVRAIYPSVAEDEDFVALFTEEARSLSQLSSSNVVRVIEVGRESGIPFVAQEHVEGIALERLLTLAEDRGTRCHWELAAHVTAEILRGLDHVHRREDVRGIPLAMRHGDVRPPNVLVSFNGEVKLTNFSSSLYFMVNEATNAQFETERGIFSPPEGRVVLQQGATVANDLWGASIILLFLLEGSNALKHIRNFSPNGESLTSIAYRIRGVPKRVNLLLARALHSDPRHRFESAAAMRDTLLEIIKESGEGHPPDDLAAFVKDLGAADREEEELFVRKMVGREASMSLDESSDLGKISPGVIIDGKYQLLRLLGEGGMGQVFEAEHVGIEKRVAVKVLHERVLHDEVAVERFRREAKIMGGLGHPNIVGVSDYGVTAEGNYYLVMELLDGGSLGAKIADQGSIPSEEIVEIMIPVCRGLAAAHAAEVVHRDLKPDNIFLTKVGPRIVDFGIAKRADMEEESHSLTRTGNICGTVEYISPEQLTGGVVDHLVDIYTAGLIIYEALTGVTPFKGRNIAETMHRIMTDKVVSPRKRTGNRGIPRILEEVCLKAMAREPEKRFQSADEMRLALEEVREIFTGITGEFLTPPSQAAKLRNIALAVGFSGAVLTGAIVYYVAGPKRSTDDATTIPATAVTETVSTATEPRTEPVPPSEKSAPSTKSAAAQAPAVDATSVHVESEAGDTARLRAEEAAARKEELLTLAERDFRTGNWSGAEFHYKSASELDPTDPRCWFGLGKTAFEQNRPGRAKIMIQKALRLDPGKYKWRIYLGKVYMATNERDKAVREWKRVLATRSQDAETRRLLATVGEEM